MLKEQAEWRAKVEEKKRQQEEKMKLEEAAPPIDVKVMQVEPSGEAAGIHIS